MTAEAQTPAAMEQAKLAVEAYITAISLVRNVDSFAAYVAGRSWPMKSPYDEFGHGRELAGPETEFVSPNNDTCYSIAACDVRHEPLVLHVPDTADRYYVLQFIDAWTNNFAYVGQRATGTAEAEYLPAARDETACASSASQARWMPLARIGVVASEMTLYTIEATEDVLGCKSLAGKRPTASA